MRLGAELQTDQGERLSEASTELELDPGWNGVVAAAEMAEAEADVLIAAAANVPCMSVRDSLERVIQAGYQAAREALKDWRAG